MSASTGFKARKTRRAPVACGACHSRKVRCNVALSGQPCANCEQDDVECVLHVSARGKYRRRRSAAAHEGLTAIVASKELRTNPAVPVQGPSFQGSNLSGKVEATALQSAFQRQDDYESPSNIGAYRNILEPTPIHGHRVPLYVGEIQTLRYVFNIAQDKTVASRAHFLVPAAEGRHLLPEESKVLEAKGAFNLQSEDLRSKLLGLYFDFVHPILPVIDPSDFLSRFDEYGPASISPLLLQSMFLAASNFVPREFLRNFGYASIFELKRSFYERAKALYDFEYESDKTCLIQSVLLMGYWLGNSQDRTDSWHWIGVAISLSQSAGLHRDRGPASISPTQRRLWKRIWWCCFCRDRCISLGMGRPIRIRVADCDVEPLTVNDLACTPPLSRLSAKSSAIIERCNNVAPVFLEIVRIMQPLGDVLTHIYQPKRENSLWNTVGKIDDDLNGRVRGPDPRCQVKLDLPKEFSDNATTLHQHYIHTLHHVTIITLYKPFVFQGGLLPTHYDEESQERIAWARCLSSASAASDSFRTLTELELIQILPPESVTMLISIIAILFTAKSLESGIRWHLASQNLDLVMLILEELQEKYLAARFVYTYYKAAFDKIASYLHKHEQRSGGTGALSSEQGGGVAGDFVRQETPDGSDLDIVAGTNLFSELDNTSAQTTWAGWFLPEMGADFELLFGTEGIFK